MPSPLQLHGPLGAGRTGWQAAVRALAAPATRAAALGPAQTPVVMSNHDPLANWFELVTRPLWGLAPLAAGGGAAPTAWAEVRAGLAAAVDPGHPWYVGAPVPVDQKLVEAAAVGYALAIAPEQAWEPLTGRQRDHLAAWLAGAYRVEVADTNWRFFPVLVGLGLARIGVATDAAVSAAHLDRLASFADDTGWYTDGPGGRVDYYNAFAFHWYGLLYAALTGDDRFVAGAAGFAGQFARWFAADGSAVPYGRSLGYRFAQGAFWGALVTADVEALAWDRVRDLAHRHLGWWWQQPILDHAGALTVGYRYPNDALVEQYLTAGSPYWGLKFFAPLAVGDHHPFWTPVETETGTETETSAETETSTAATWAETEPATETATETATWGRSAPAPPGAAVAVAAVRSQPRPPVPGDVRGRVEVCAQPGARAVLARDADGDVVRLNGQAWHPWARNGQPTYAKFAYGTLAGFAVPTPGPGPECAAPDGALLLSEDGRHWRGREDSDEGEVDGDTVRIGWTPWPDVRVRTVLVAAPPWHLRVHHVVTGRRLQIVEGGWCVPWRPAGAGHAAATAWAAGEGVHSLLVGLSGERTARVIEPMPGTHLLWPRTLLPLLDGVLAPGAHRLACAVRVGRTAAEPHCPVELAARAEQIGQTFSIR